MKITILGCGGSGGVPMIGGDDGEGVWGTCDPLNPKNLRTRSSIVLQSTEGKRILVDTSPDIRQQFLRERIVAVDAILYTHEHFDHVAGFDEIRAINRAIGKPVPVYASERVLDDLQRRFAYAFAPWTGPHFFRPVPQPFTIPIGKTLDIAGFSIVAFEQEHAKITTLGVRSGGFAYSTDVSRLDDHAFSHLCGVDTWVVGCFQYAPHVAHASVDLVLSWRERVKPRRLILTHMGPGLDYEQLRRNLPEGVEPAYDGMVLNVV